MARRSMTFRAGILVAAAAIAFSSGPAPAQSGRKPRPPAGVPASGTNDSNADDGELRIGTQEVLLSITVRDAEGRPVTDLGRDDFILAEDRTRQKIESYSTERAPINVLLLLDASGSVFSERYSIRRAAASFAERLGPEDRVSVVQFADKVELLQDWTSSHDDVKLALDWRYKGGEMTDLWDALFVAADEQLAKVDGRRAVIVLTDGEDTSSTVTFEQAAAALDRADTSLYVVSKAEAIVRKLGAYTGIGGKVAGVSGMAAERIERLRQAEERMRGLADRYGGRLFSPIRDEDLSAVYGQVADELKKQYVLSYVSSNERRDGGWRTIEVFLTRPGLSARTRKGYIAQ